MILNEITRERSCHWVPNQRHMHYAHAFCTNCNHHTYAKALADIKMRKLPKQMTKAQKQYNDCFIIHIKSYRTSADYEHEYEYEYEYDVCERTCL